MINFRERFVKDGVRYLGAGREGDIADNEKRHFYTFRNRTDRLASYHFKMIQQTMNAPKPPPQETM